MHLNVDRLMNAFTLNQTPMLRAGRRKSQPAIEKLEQRELMAAGFFDTTFNSTIQAKLTHSVGRFKIDPGGGTPGTVASGVQAIAVQANGKIVVAGHAPGARTTLGRHSPISDIVVARLLPNGGLDRSFGTGGIERINFGATANTDSVSSIAIDGVGRIIVAGTASRSDGSPEAVVERLNANGKIDTSLGANGRSFFTFDNFSTSELHFHGFQTAGMVQDSNGNIVIAGTILESSGNNEFGVARLGINGPFDQSFGIGGQSLAAVYGIDMNGDHAAGIAIDSHGRIVVAGSAQEVNVQNGSAVAVLRLQSNGSADPAFGNEAYGHTIIPGIYIDGTSTAPFHAVGVAIAPGDQIVIAGDNNSGNVSSTEFLVSRITAGGTTDTSFGSGGYSYANVPANYKQALARGVLVDSAGRVVVVGAFVGNATVTSGLVRIQSNGYYDPSFGSGGVSVAGFGEQGDEGTSVVLDPKGRIVFGSEVFGKNRPLFGVARILT